MRKLCLAALLALVSVSAASADLGQVHFTITATKDGQASRTATLTTTPGLEASYANVLEGFVVNEVNSEYGHADAVFSEVDTGFTSKLLYTPCADADCVETTFDFTWLDNGVVIAKGHHVVKLKPGETVSLPAANDAHVTLVAKP